MTGTSYLLIERILIFIEEFISFFLDLIYLVISIVNFILIPFYACFDRIFNFFVDYYLQCKKRFGFGYSRSSFNFDIFDCYHYHIIFDSDKILYGRSLEKLRDILSPTKEYCPCYMCKFPQYFSICTNVKKRIRKQSSG